MWTKRYPVTVSLVVLLALGSRASAQVDCSDANNLCTGDPCVIPTLVVADPCVVDFGARTVIVAGTLRAQSGGVLSLTAGSLRVEGRVGNVANPAQPAPGPSISLAATGDVDVTGRIVVSRTAPATVDLHAGGNLTLGGAIRTSVTSTVTLAADGDVDIRGTILTRSRSVARGTVVVTAGGNLVLSGTINDPASLTLDAAGDVDLGGSLVTRGKVGTAAVDAGGMLVAHARVRLPTYHLALHGGAGVRVDGAIDVRRGGVVDLASAVGDVSIDMPVHADRDPHFGSAISVMAGGNVAVNAVVSASGTFGSGGSIVISSPGGDVTLAGDVEAKGANTGNQGGFPGGSVQVSAGGSVLVGAGVRVNALPGTVAHGGSVRIDGASVQVTPAATIDADGGDAPSSVLPEIRLTATGGSLALSGTFLARGGPSVVQGTASGNIVADGDFRCAPNGCIGFDAGGTLDLSGGAFDEPIVTTCP